MFLNITCKMSSPIDTLRAQIAIKVEAVTKIRTCKQKKTNNVREKYKIGHDLNCAEGTVSRWSQLHLQSLARTNPHWDHVVDYGRSFYV
jgi:hypothetical protein